MKKVMKLALLMASALTLSPISFASDTLQEFGSQPKYSKQYTGHSISNAGLLKSPEIHDHYLAHLSQPNHFKTSHLKTEADAQSLPASIDNSAVYNIFNQGELGSCTANAIAGCIYARQVIQYMDNHPGVAIAQAKQAVPIPSRLFIYHNELTIEHPMWKKWSILFKDVGASLSTGLIVLTTMGVPPESEWTYDDNQDHKNKFKQNPPAQCYIDAKFTEDLDQIIHARIDPTASNVLQQIKQAVTNKYFIVIGAIVFDNFQSQQVADTGILEMPDFDLNQPVGGHALGIVGYNDNDQTFLIANSWDTTWGLKGFFKMPYDYFTQSFQGQPLVSEIYYIDKVSNASPAAAAYKASLPNVFGHLTHLAISDLSVSFGINAVKKLENSITSMIQAFSRMNKTD